MKSFFKGFFNIILWIIAILALGTSLYVMVKQVGNYKNDVGILEVEERIEQLEEQNKQLEKEIEEAKYSVKNHIHQQYMIGSRYSSEEYHYNRNIVRIKNDPDIIQGGQWPMPGRN